MPYTSTVHHHVAITMFWASKTVLKLILLEKMFKPT